MLAGLVVHLLLNNGHINDEHNINNRESSDGVHHSTEHAVYLKMLPTQTPEEKHALWWTEEEMDLARGMSGYQEWVEMREDVDEMICVIIGSGVLLVDVEVYGDAAVHRAVRAGFVAVLSRAYGVFSGDGREFKALIPLLEDALNHANIPNVYEIQTTGTRYIRQEEGLATLEKGRQEQVGN